MTTTAASYDVAKLATQLVGFGIVEYVEEKELIMKDIGIFAVAAVVNNMWLAPKVQSMLPAVDASKVGKAVEIVLTDLVGAGVPYYLLSKVIGNDSHATPRKTVMKVLGSTAASYLYTYGLSM